MCGRFILAIAFATIAFLSATAPSQAELRVCNKSTERFDVALGYDAGRRGWIAEGWWEVGIDKCITIFGGRLNNRYYYLYAKGDDGAEWHGEEDDDGSEFCIKEEKFTLRRQDDCSKGGGEAKMFFVVDVGNYRRWTQTLENSDDEVAQSPPPPPDKNPSPSVGTSGGNACQRYPNLC